MYTSQVVSHAHSPVRVPRRPVLYALGAVLVIGLMLIMITLAARSGVDHAGTATPSHAVSHTFTLPHIKGLDTPPSPNTAVQFEPASPGSGYVRVYPLLRVTTGTKDQPAATQVAHV
jgi:hypothetical protein